MNIYVLPIAITVLFGLLAAFSFMSSELKFALLSSDRDGLEPMVLGAVLALVGLFTPDYVTARLLVTLGGLFIAFGGLIALPDGVTDQILHPLSGVVFGILAVASFAYGSIKAGPMIYNLHALVSLILPVGGATVVATLTALSLTSETFRDRLSEQVGGQWLEITGLLTFVLSPFAALNPALMVGTAGLGALLTTLGALVAMNDNDMDSFLSKGKLFAYVPVAIALLYIARLAF